MTRISTAEPIYRCQSVKKLDFSRERNNITKNPFGNEEVNI
jgi:hypothetical protein